MEDLNNLESTNEVKEILRTSKSLYKKEASTNPPCSFDSLMDQIALRERYSIKWKNSPWWMVAACVVGLLIGWTFPFTKSGVGEKLAANDTIYITNKQVDTLFRQEHVLASKSVHKPIRSVVSKYGKQTPERVNKIHELPTPDIQKPTSASVGRTISQEQTPTHLYVCL